MAFLISDGEYSLVYKNQVLLTNIDGNWFRNLSGER